MTMAWGDNTDFATVCRRAGGRRAYNCLRRFRQLRRRRRVEELRYDYGPFARGVVTRIAKELGVSKSTISRDLQAIFARYREE